VTLIINRDAKNQEGKLVSFIEIHEMKSAIRLLEHCLAAALLLIIALPAQAVVIQYPDVAGDFLAAFEWDDTGEETGTLTVTDTNLVVGVYEQANFQIDSGSLEPFFLDYNLTANFINGVFNPTGSTLTLDIANAGSGTGIAEIKALVYG
jgi:hypothetical protein